MIKACLFDVFGTLLSGTQNGSAGADTAATSAWNDSVDELNSVSYHPTEERTNLTDSAKAFFGRSGAQASEAVLPGALDFVKELHRNGVKLASVSIQGHPERSLSRAGLYGMFDYVADPAVEGKRPQKDIILQAVKQLGVNRSDCVVFEHTPEGIDAAHRAGVRCVVVGELNHLHQSAAMGVRSLDGFTLLKLKDGIEVSEYQC